jgi:cathepsin A (carboxypeptidase C)
LEFCKNYKNKMQLIVALILAVFAVTFVFGNDEIKRLPGLKNNINFKHYSGYLQVSRTHFLHYWFVESQNDPANDPLIFWYNGGPGCSSLLGLLTEMGPYEINSNGKTLHENPNAWNKFASVVYIEAPAGVGFSFSTDGNTTTNDDQTAIENYEGIKQFFMRHPSFQNHSTFITGESYGGIYLPMLASQIINGQNDYPINFDGMAIGNGLLSDKLSSETTLPFMYYHGMIGETLWTKIQKDCCDGCIETCDFSNVTEKCYRIIGSVENNNYGINPYNIYDICDPNSKHNSRRFYAYQEKLVPKQFQFFKDGLKANKDPCMEDTQITSYMNLPYVRRALHILKDLPEWEECSGVGYQRQYNDMTTFFEKILEAKVPILLYYGDVDMVCNFMHGQKFVSQLGLPIKKEQTLWEVNDQTAGFQTVYEGLTFITIRGAGHMAPGWKAPQTYHALKQFVFNQPI